AESLAEAAPGIPEAICGTVGWQFGALWTLDPAERVLRCVDVWRAEKADADDFEVATRTRTFAAGTGLPGRVLESGTPAWIPDVVADRNFPRAPLASRARLHGAFGFPILVGDEVLGVIEAFRPKIEEPDQELLQLMGAIGSHIGEFIERKEAERAVRVSE